MANAFVAGADEVAFHKLVDYPLSSLAGKGARTAVRYMSHVTRQHPDRRKWPDISGERAANAYFGTGAHRPSRPGVRDECDLQPPARALDMTLTFSVTDSAPDPVIHLGDHAGRRAQAGTRGLSANPGSASKHVQRLWQELGLGGRRHARGALFGQREPDDGPGDSGGPWIID